MPIADQQEIKRRLNDIGHAVNERLPDGYGFIVFVAPIGEPTPDSRLNYISNLQRETAINSLKEWLIKAGAAEDWMRHIK